MTVTVMIFIGVQLKIPEEAACENNVKQHVEASLCTLFPAGRFPCLPLASASLCSLLMLMLLKTLSLVFNDGTLYCVASFAVRVLTGAL